MKKINLIFLLILPLCFGCTKKSQGKEVKPVSVKIAKSQVKDVPLYISTVGHMEAYTTVDVMAQANGYLIDTFFTDGAYINKGELLYLIDQKPYAAALQKAEGNLDQALANLKFAERTAERNAPLAKEDFISKESYDNFITNVLVDDASVKQNMAEVETAKINLDYTTIYAPMDARAGASLVKNGNLVLESAETKLVTLNQIVPIYATFYITEKDLPIIQRYQKKCHELKTIINVEDPNTAASDGKLTFINNAVDLVTGMVQMKATLQNEDKSLWPNQYIHVTLILDTIENAVLVPAEAIQLSPKGPYVFVVKTNKTVEIRLVTLGQRQNDFIVIEKGVQGGEKVVTEGQVNLFQGAKVSINKEDNG